MVGAALLKACASQNSAHVHQHIIANLGRLPYDHAHAVVDEKPAAYFSAWVYFYSCKEAGYMGGEAGKEKEPVHPEKVGYPVHPDGMQARIAGYDLPDALGSRVFGKDRLDVLSDAHFSVSLLPFYFTVYH
jgi:hypothetical protein